MAVEKLESSARIPIPRKGRIRRCRVRHVSILPAGDGPRVQLLASGISVRHALQAQELLAADWGVAADVWSVTSWNELRRDAVACEARALLDPDAGAVPAVTQALTGADGPFVAVSDWMRSVPDQISRWVPGDWTSLGTDGFGRSDTRAALRRHFHIDPESIATAALRELARRGEVPADAARVDAQALGIDPKARAETLDVAQFCLIANALAPASGPGAKARPASSARNP